MIKNKRLLIKIAYRVLLLALLVGALCISSGKTRIIFCVFGAAAFAVSLIWNKLKSVHRKLLLLAVGVLFILLNIYYNAIYINKMLPLRHAKNQHIYQPEDEEYGSMCDAYLRESIRNKSVLVPYAVQKYIVYNPVEDEEERAEHFEARYYLENNYTRYFMEYSGECSTDESLLKTDAVTEIASDLKSAFVDLGITNDLLRYSFLLNQEHSKETKYFWYSWYYYFFAVEEDHYPHLYVDKASCESASQLVAIWDKDENLYLMGSDKYKEVCQ